MMKQSSLLCGWDSQSTIERKDHGGITVSSPADSRGNKTDLRIIPCDTSYPLSWLCSLFCYNWSSQDDGTQQDRNLVGYSSNIMDK